MRLPTYVESDRYEREMFLTAAIFVGNVDQYFLTFVFSYNPVLIVF